MAVRLPTLDQIDRLGSDFGLVLTADEIAGISAGLQGTAGLLRPAGRIGAACPGAGCAAIAGLPACGIGKSLRRLVLEDEYQDRQRKDC